MRVQVQAEITPERALTPVMTRPPRDMKPSSGLPGAGGASSSHIADQHPPLPPPRFRAGRSAHPGPDRVNGAAKPPDDVVVQIRQCG